MDEFREQVLAAKTDERQFDALVNSHRQWILRVAAEAAHHYVTDSDDEWSVALMAFHEAVQSYDEGKGSVRALASAVIKRRIVDYLRSEGRHSAEIVVMPGAFDGEMTEDEAGGVNLRVQQKVAEDSLSDSAEDRANRAREEIAEMQAVLKEYGFSFFDLAYMLSLTGCGTETSTATEYSGFTVTRQGRETCITDTATGAEYHFITRRVKRPQDAAERARMNTVADTDTLTIRNAYNVIIVTINATGETYLFRERK